MELDRSPKADLQVYGNLIYDRDGTVDHQRKDRLSISGAQNLLFIQGLPYDLTPYPKVNSVRIQSKMYNTIL